MTDIKTITGKTELGDFISEEYPFIKERDALIENLHEACLSAYGRFGGQNRLYTTCVGSGEVELHIGCHNPADSTLKNIHYAINTASGDLDLRASGGFIFLERNLYNGDQSAHSFGPQYTEFTFEPDGEMEHLNKYTFHFPSDPSAPARFTVFDPDYKPPAPLRDRVFVESYPNLTEYHVHLDDGDDGLWLAPNTYADACQQLVEDPSRTPRADDCSSTDVVKADGGGVYYPVTFSEGGDSQSVTLTPRGIEESAIPDDADPRMTFDKMEFIESIVNGSYLPPKRREQTTRTAEELWDDDV